MATSLIITLLLLTVTREGIAQTSNELSPLKPSAANALIKDQDAKHFPNSVPSGDGASRGGLNVVVPPRQPGLDFDDSGPGSDVTGFDPLRDFIAFPSREQLMEARRRIITEKRMPFEPLPVNDFESFDSQMDIQNKATFPSDSPADVQKESSRDIAGRKVRQHVGRINRSRAKKEPIITEQLAHFEPNSRPMTETINPEPGFSFNPSVDENKPVVQDIKLMDANKVVVHDPIKVDHPVDFALASAQPIVADEKANLIPVDQSQPVDQANLPFIDLGQFALVPDNTHVQTDLNSLDQKLAPPIKTENKPLGTEINGNVAPLSDLTLDKPALSSEFKEKPAITLDSPVVADSKPMDAGISDKKDPSLSLPIEPINQLPVDLSGKIFSPVDIPFDLDTRPGTEPVLLDIPLDPSTKPLTADTKLHPLVDFPIDPSTKPLSAADVPLAPKAKPLPEDISGKPLSDHKGGKDVLAGDLVPIHKETIMNTGKKEKRPVGLKENTDPLIAVIGRKTDPVLTGGEEKGPGFMSDIPMSNSKKSKRFIPRVKGQKRGWKRMPLMDRIMHDFLRIHDSLQTGKGIRLIPLRKPCDSSKKDKNNKDINHKKMKSDDNGKESKVNVIKGKEDIKGKDIKDLLPGKGQSTKYQGRNRPFYLMRWPYRPRIVPRRRYPTSSTQRGLRRRYCPFGRCWSPQRWRLIRRRRPSPRRRIMPRGGPRRIARPRRPFIVRSPYLANLFRNYAQAYDRIHGGKSLKPIMKPVISKKENPKNKLPVDNKDIIISGTEVNIKPKLPVDGKDMKVPAVLDKHVVANEKMPSI